MVERITETPSNWYKLIKDYDSNLLKWYKPESNSTEIYEVLMKSTLSNDIVVLIMQYTSYYNESCRGKISRGDISIYITHLNVSCTSIRFNTSNLVQLSCNSCRLDALPALPSCEKLECNHNNLTALPRLDVCEYLDCEYNKLTLLPLLPMCMFLNCRKNDITALPTMSKLIRLECDCNELVEIPYYSSSKYIICFNNNFIKQPFKPQDCTIAWYNTPWLMIVG